MAHGPLTIMIDPDSELGRALGAGDLDSVVLQRGNARFRITREPDDPWASYDSEKIRAGLHELAGMLSPEEGEQIKERIYRGREEGSRPITRP
ncbi:MAG: hypothetical protein IT337_09125 [Thermomicrobiales bacterium]|nr:hypothetical protein [Thermomicrobiales bacterium]